MLRFGLIGAGQLGKAHAESLAHLPQAALAAVVDVDPQATAELRERWAPNVAAINVNELLVSGEIDAVIVATPTPLHFQHAKAALETGKHVYCEMPMTRHLCEAEELTALAKESGKTLTVGHTLRGYHEYELIRQKTLDGAAGKPGTIRLGRRTPHPHRWYSNFESSGGVVLDSMIHEFDFLRWTFGPVKRVFCNGMKGRVNTETIDYALASLRMESGAIAHVESSWSHYGQFQLDVEVAGDKGVVQYANQETIPLLVSFIDPQKGTRHFFSESPVIKPAHFKIMEGFIAAVEGKGPNPVPPEDGLEALRIAFAALGSIETHRPVTLRG